MSELLRISKEIELDLMFDRRTQKEDILYCISGLIEAVEGLQADSETNNGN